MEVDELKYIRCALQFYRRRVAYWDLPLAKRIEREWAEQHGAQEGQSEIAHEGRGAER